MATPEDEEPAELIRNALQSSGPASAAARIQEYLDEQNNIPLHIGITGEAGSGKSTFVNAFRGISSRDPGAAPTGVVETTTVPMPYLHPVHQNVTIWDLPGIGTMNFPAVAYLEFVEFSKFDFFIIISDTRFRENDVKLALETRRMGKKFYFVRSKIDHSLRDEEETQNDFNPLVTLQKIRDNCIEGLKKQGFQDPQVFLISSRSLHQHDFVKLQETLERELPKHKTDALLLAMPNVSRGIIGKKKSAFQKKIKYYAALSAFVASAPVPGLSFTFDVAILVKIIKEYQLAFNLDPESLDKLAVSARVPLESLKAVIRSTLSANTLTKDMVIKVLAFSAGETALMAAEEGSRFIPLFGIPIAAALSFTATYSMLNTALNMLADDAQRVFTKALGLDTSV